MKEVVLEMDEKEIKKHVTDFMDFVKTYGKLFDIDVKVIEKNDSVQVEVKGYTNILFKIKKKKKES